MGPFRQLDVVRLNTDLPDEGIPRGTSGTVVTIFSTEPPMYEVEFTDTNGTPVALATLPEEALDGAAEHWTNQQVIRKTPAEFLQTVYLGDRACKGLRIESWARRVELELDSISRIHAKPGIWEPGPGNEIPNGRIVISGVVSVQLTPPGPLPNDFVEIVARPLVNSSDELWEFEVLIGSVAPDATTTEITVRIIGTDIHLEDPARPEVAIRD